MNTAIKALILKIIIQIINPDMIVGLVRTAIESIKQAVLSSETKWDDKTILPVIEKLEKALKI